MNVRSTNLAAQLTASMRPRVMWIARLLRLSWLPAGLLLVLVTGGAASAECTAFRPWPAFTTVAPTAERVIIGTVLQGFDEPKSPRHGSFALRVDQVLRGRSAPTLRFIHGLVSPLDPVGYYDCPPDNPLWVRVGWQIAIAFDGRYPGAKGRVTTVAVIRGRPDPDNPRLQKLSYGQVVAAAGLPGTDASATSSPSGDAPIGLVTLPGAAFVGLVAFLALRRRTPTSPSARRTS